MDAHVKLEKGDVLLLYTDGIVEAKNEKGVMYENRIINTLAENGSKSPKEIKAAIIDSLEGFYNDDDMTMVVLKKL